MQKGSLLTALRRVEAAMPKLLDTEEGWSTLDITYDPPRVERLWREYEGYRVCLHRIHPCEKALFHPHPWPSAIKVLSGRYEMGIGFGVAKADPPEAATLILTAGSSYEMIHPDGWHYVRPLEVPSLSVMVNGPPWDLRHLGEKSPQGRLGPLADRDRDDLFNQFQKLYWR